MNAVIEKEPRQRDDQSMHTYADTDVNCVAQFDVTECEATTSNAAVPRNKLLSADESHECYKDALIKKVSFFQCVFSVLCKCHLNFILLLQKFE